VLHFIWSARRRLLTGEPDDDVEVVDLV
jgi:hypothetical protein